MPRIDLVVPKRELLPNVVEVLSLVTEYDKPSWEYDRYRVKQKTAIHHWTYEMCKTISSCLARHQFSNAAVLLNALGEKNMIDLFFFKAALIVLENDPSNTTSSILAFMRLVKSLKDVSKCEVILESIVYALRKNEITEHFNFKFMVEEMANSTSRNTPNFIIDPLVNAYLGLFDYVRWCQKKDVTSAENAISSFKEAIEVPGQWDIFILKLVEMLVFYNRVGEAEEALSKYAEINPEHINSHIYLSTFLQQINPESEKLLDNLKEITEKCPSDPRVLILAEIWQETYPKKSLKVLLMFLDYPANSENLKAWKLLYRQLVQMLESYISSHIRAINTQWGYRMDFWPYIHFSEKHLNMDKSSFNVPFEKASVLCVFESSHPYIQEVLEKLETVSRKMHNRLLERINYINELHCTTDNSE